MRKKQNEEQSNLCAVFLFDCLKEGRFNLFCEKEKYTKRKETEGIARDDKEINKSNQQQMFTD